MGLNQTRAKGSPLEKYLIATKKESLTLSRGMKMSRLLMMMISENHNGHGSVWQQVSTKEPFIWTQYLWSDLTTQNSFHRAGEEGGGQVKLDNSHVKGGLVLTSYHLCGGGMEGRGGGNGRSS